MAGKPLHGVPCTVKDVFETAGVRTTAGAPFLADYVPQQDAPVVARLKAAGAVIVGKTNVPVMAADWQSYTTQISARPRILRDITRNAGRLQRR